jgi:hypothetical protein
MNRYFFHTDDGSGRDQDTEGVCLSDGAAALRMAHKAATEIARELPALEGPQAIGIDVVAEDQTLVGRVRITIVVEDAKSSLSDPNLHVDTADQTPQRRKGPPSRRSEEHHGEA